MNPVVTAGVATLVSAAMLCAGEAQAMQIWRFDQMADEDQVAYVAALRQSVKDAMSVEQLPRVKRFFLAKQPGEKISGLGQFEMNLSLARVADVQARDKNPKARRLEIEDVMYVTLERNGIALPAGFRPVAAHFQPTQSVSTHTVSKEEADKALGETRAWVARSVPARPNFQSDGGPTLSGFANAEKGIAFFAGLIALAIAADKSGGSSDADSPPAPSTPDWSPWWEQAGYTTYGQAVHAVCVGNSTSAHPNC